MREALRVGLAIICIAGGAACATSTEESTDPPSVHIGSVALPHHADDDPLPRAQIKTARASGDPFLHRTGHQVVAIKDDLFILRGVEDDIATQANTFRSDVFRLDPKHGQRVKLKELNERGDTDAGIAPDMAFHCTVGDRRHGGELLTFGGAHFLFQGDPGFFQSLVVFNTLWRYRVSNGKWETITPADGGLAPPARAGCNAEEFNGSMYMFGGLNRFLQLNNELWRFDIEGETWTRLTPTGPVPPPRFIGATTVDHDAGKIYLYNGHRAGPFGFETIGDFWVYDVATNTFRQLPPIPAVARDEGTLTILRAPHSGKKYLVQTAGHVRSAVLCSGFTERTTATNEVWAFDPDAETWHQLEVVGEQPRLEFVRGATVDNKHYLVGGWFDVPDPVNTCRQVWNEDFFELTLVR